MKTLRQEIQDALTVDLLSPAWQARLQPADHPTRGHCYVAAEAAYHVYGKRRGFSPRVLRIDGATHWYLENKATGERFDPTAEQFTSPPPYAKGRHCPFLTRKPSKRARVLLRRLRVRRVPPHTAAL